MLGRKRSGRASSRRRPEADLLRGSFATSLRAERPLREYELLSEVSSSWNSETRLNAFIIKRCKISALLTLQVSLFPLVISLLLLSSSTTRLLSSFLFASLVATSDLTRLSFSLSLSSSSVFYFSSLSPSHHLQAIPNQPPNIIGWVQMEVKKGSWKKRFLEIREGSVWICKNDRVSARPSFLAFLCLLLKSKKREYRSRADSSSSFWVRAFSFRERTRRSSVRCPRTTSTPSQDRTRLLRGESGG